MLKVCILCDRPAKAKCDGSKGGIVYAGPLCAAHYAKLVRNGDPLKAVPRGRQLGQRFRTQGDKRYAKGDGYYTLWMPDHPNSNKNGAILEHRYVMSKHLGRPLTDEENVHHINGDKGDNSLANLELWNTSQPKGQRVEDKIEWARAILAQYTGSKECG